jgi:hypothetical protein
MADLKDNVKRMLEAGVPKEKITAYIRKHSQKSGGVLSLEDQYSGPEYKQTQLSQEHPVRREISRGVRTVLEGGGLVAGSIIGTAGGLAASGGNPLVGVAGGVGGAGMGFSMASNMSDRIHEWLGLGEGMNLQESTIEAINDVAKGAEMEMFGGAIFGAVKGFGNIYNRVKSWMDISDAAALKQAEETYQSIFKNNPKALETAEKTDEVMKRMNIKTKLTKAQQTGSKRAALLEQKLFKNDDSMASEVLNRREAIRGEAQNTLKKKFSGSIEDAVGGVSKHQQALQSRANAAKQEADDFVNQVRASRPTQETGENIYNQLAQNKAAAKKVVDDEYAKIPKNITVQSSPLKDFIKSVVDEFKNRGGGNKSYPGEFIGKMKNKIKSGDGTVSFDQLREWRSWLLEDIRAAKSGAEPNLKLARRLGQIREGVEKTMDQLLKSKDEAVKLQYDKASKIFKKYYDMYRGGTVGEVLSPSGKVGKSSVPSKFFSNPEAADDLIRGVGKEKAAEFVEDYIGFTISNKILDSSSATKAWLFKNKEMLNKYGLYDKYSQMAKKMEVSEKVLAELTDFNKGVASKVLDSNVDNVIESVFGKSGTKTNSASLMNDLLNMPGIKGNDAALNGIKSAFKDFILKRAKTYGGDGVEMHTVAKMNKALEENMNAMRVLYRGDMKKVQALQDYKKVLSYLQRNMNVTASGGSTTAEKMSQVKEGFISNALQLMAIKLGKGWFFSSVKRLWNSFLNFPKNMTESMKEDFLRKALLDPDAAYTLFKGATKNKNFERDILRHAITMGIVTTDNLTQDNYPKGQP